MSGCQYTRFLGLRTQKAKRCFGNRKKEIEQEMKFKNSMLNHLVITNRGGDMSSATKTLRQNGYTNVQTHGYGFFECSQNDKFATKFSATSPSGYYVTGTVCSGFFKGSTIRFD